MRRYLFATSLILAAASCRNRPGPDTLAFRERMGASHRIAVVVASKNWEEALVKLGSIPREIAFRLEYRDAAAILFFKRHTPLYLSVEDLKAVHQFLKKSLQFEKDLFNPAHFFSGKNLKRPEIDLEEMAERYAEIRPYETLPRGRKVIYLYGNSSDEMKESVRKALRDLEFQAEDVKEIPVLAESREQASIIAQRLREAQLGKVRTLSDYVPLQQPEKIVVLKKIRNFLTPKILSYLSSEDRKWAERFLTLEIFEPFSEDSLPSSVLTHYTERNGARGRLLYVDGPRDQIRKVAKSVSEKAIIP